MLVAQFSDRYRKKKNQYDNKSSTAFCAVMDFYVLAYDRCQAVRVLPNRKTNTK